MGSYRQLAEVADVRSISFIRQTEETPKPPSSGRPLALSRYWLEC